MGIFNKLFGKKESQKVKDEHAIIIYIKLNDSEFGDEAERNDIIVLENKLEEIFSASNLGEFDGNEFGGGYGTLYMYGYNADNMHNAIKSTLLEYKFRSGSYLIKRYGVPGAEEVKIEL